MESYNTKELPHRSVHCLAFSSSFHPIHHSNLYISIGAHVYMGL